jgi:hypothetical protein
LLPECPLADVGLAELPILVWCVDALQEALPLFFLRDVLRVLDQLVLELLLQVDALLRLAAPA